MKRFHEYLCFAAIATVTVIAAGVGLVGCKPVGNPSPRPPYSEDADKPDYRCAYDGNHRCPTTGEVRR